MRRRLLVALAGLLCVGILMAWWLTPRCDPRLAGNWIVTTDARSDWSENWEFQASGIGFRNSRREASPGGYRVLALNDGFRWWTDGDRLYIRWGTTATGRYRVREIAHNLGRVARGEPERFPVDEHTYAVEDDQTLRIAPPPTPMDLTDDTLQLRRMEEQPN
ncbi:MAG: hypothetical protein JNG89_18645 [Planctomycetaceae bacterium]|nr:hypothetical protein [Planctomycetaceae bacterium]